MQSTRRREDRERGDEGRKRGSVSTGGRGGLGTEEPSERQANAKRRREESEGESESGSSTGSGSGHNDELEYYILVEDPEEMPFNNNDGDESDDDEVDGEDDDDGGFVRIMRDNWNATRSHHRDRHKIQDTYNFRVGSGIQVGEGAQHGRGFRSSPERQIRAICNRQTKRFKINLGYGFILRNVETGDFWGTSLLPCYM